MMIVDDDDSSFILEIRKYLFSIKTYLSLRLRGSWLIVTHDARIRGVVGIRIFRGSPMKLGSEGKPQKFSASKSDRSN